LAISWHLAIALEICCSRCGIFFASRTARVVNSFPAWLISPPPFEKKKLALRRCWSRYLRATGYAIVDFPVPAKLFSQKMSRSPLLSAYLYMSFRSPTRVLGRQLGLYWRLYELKCAFVADGRRLSGSLRPIVGQFLQFSAGGVTEVEKAEPHCCRVQEGMLLSHQSVQYLLALYLA
jgi:hypothetical protein